MTLPEYEKYGYEPELDSVNHFSYVNRNYTYGEPYRIGALPDGEGGWGVYIQWKEGTEPGGAHQTKYEHVEGDLHNYTEHQSQREKRFDAAMAIERAMEEHHTGSDITGGL